MTMMEKSNKKGTLKVMMSNISNGILPLDEHCITASSRTTSGFKNVDKAEKNHMSSNLSASIYEVLLKCAALKMRGN